MSHATSSKAATADLIDSITAPEPSQEAGLGTHFGSTFTTTPNKSSTTSSLKELASNNPFRTEAERSSPTSKSRVAISGRPLSRDYHEAPLATLNASPRRRADSLRSGPPPPSYDVATSPQGSPSGKTTRHRRSSSLKERFPGDKSHQPLDIIRRDSKKAYRSPHLRKQHIPGADLIDRLDPAVDGRAYHHEGPYDAALLARNTRPETSPIAALKTSNEEALKATPPENIKDAVERHQPLDGVAVVPPGVPDRFGRTFNYEEGADLMHETNADGPGYKRWADKDYDPDDLKGEGEPTFSLDRALQADKIDDDGIELSDRAQISKEYKEAKHKGTLDARDPVEIAGDDRKYVGLEFANSTESDMKRTGSLRAAGHSLKKRIGSLRHKRDE